MRTVIIISVCLFIAVRAIGQPPVKYKSTEIYDFSRQIKKIVKDEIWTGFDFENYSRTKTADGAGFIYFSNEPDNQTNENFSWKLVDAYFQDHSLEDNLVITFHEAFHAFQRDTRRAGGKWGAENALLIFEYQESGARSNALFSIESRMLRSALLSVNKTGLKDKVRQFLAVRHLRQSELEPRFVEFEKNAELNEGLAEYAGTKAVMLGLEARGKKLISVPFTESDLKGFVSKRFEMLDSITEVGQNIRRKFYYTGSAEGLLLDRLMPDWKTKVQLEHQSLQALLETSVGKLPSSREINAYLSKYSYEQVLAGEEKAVNVRLANNQTLLATTLNQKGRKYIIDYSALAKPAGIRNFDPMNVTMISPKIRVHTRSVSFAAGDSFTAAFSQPVVEDLQTRQYTTIIPENQTESLVIDGVAIDLNRPLEMRFDKSLKLNSTNFKFEAKTGFVKISNGEISINLTDN